MPVTTPIRIRVINMSISEKPDECPCIPCLFISAFTSFKTPYLVTLITSNRRATLSPIQYTAHKLVKQNNLNQHHQIRLLSRPDRRFGQIQ